MIIPISYPLSRLSPLYPGTPLVTLKRIKSIEWGDSSDSSIISFSSHAGTHIDLPRHFCQNGLSAVDLLKPETIFTPVYCINIPKHPGESISINDMRQVVIPNDASALLIRTGFYQYRNLDPEIYTSQHPPINPEIPAYLREICPNLNLLGIDTISISNPANRSSGQSAHRSFLCDRKSILLLEDADLSNNMLSQGNWTLRIFPWILDELDGVQVTAFMEKQVV